MPGRRSLAILLSLGAAALPAAAETYKWVDAKGVVNYSNSPPPESAAKKQVVEERISVVSSDPTLGAAIAAMNARAAQRARFEEADWLQRQRYLLAARTGRPNAHNANGAYDAYGTDYAPYAPYAPYYPVYGVAFASRSYFPRTMPIVGPPRPFRSTHVGFR